MVEKLRVIGIMSAGYLEMTPMEKYYFAQHLLGKIDKNVLHDRTSLLNKSVCKS